MIPWQEYKLSLERNQVDKQQAPSLTLTQTQNSNPTPNPNPNQADKQQALLRGDALYQYIVDLNCKAQNAADTTAQAGSPQGGTAEHFTETGGGLVISNPVGGAAVSVSKVQAAASMERSKAQSGTNPRASSHLTTATYRALSMWRPRPWTTCV